MEENEKVDLDSIPSIWDDLPDKEFPTTEGESSEEIDYLDEGFVSDCWSSPEIFKMRKTPKGCKCVVCRREFILDEYNICKGARKKDLTDVDSRYVYVCPECSKDKEWREKWKFFRKEQKTRPKESVMGWQKR
jgi:hypothetical protein